MSIRRTKTSGASSDYRYSFSVLFVQVLLQIPGLIRQKLESLHEWLDYESGKNAVSSIESKGADEYVASKDEVVCDLIHLQCCCVALLYGLV